jgi:hypothetical protein
VRYAGSTLGSWRHHSLFLHSPRPPPQQSGSLRQTAACVRNFDLIFQPKWSSIQSQISGSSRWKMDAGIDPRGSKINLKDRLRKKSELPVTKNVRKFS